MDESFTAWLAGNSQQLGALAISWGAGRNEGNVDGILGALADAAAAAAAAAMDGAPLQLRTLRVLGCDVALPLAGRLVGALPHLHTLQLAFRPFVVDPAESASALLNQHLGPLQQATQLQELYLKGPSMVTGETSLPCAPDMAQLLPPSLKRLSWHSNNHRHKTMEYVPDMAHLTQLSYLQLQTFALGYPSPNITAPVLQELELYGCYESSFEALLGQQQVLTGLNWTTFPLGPRVICEDNNKWQDLISFSKIRTLEFDVHDCKYGVPVMCLLERLSTVKVFVFDCPNSVGGDDMEYVSLAASSFSKLRHLHLCLSNVQGLTGLSAVTGLSRLTLRDIAFGKGPSANSAWAQEVGQLQGLRWLSVPVVLLSAGAAWLGGLQQLRVLVLHCDRKSCGAGRLGDDWWSWVLDASPQGLPAQLQVLCLSGESAERAADLQLRRRLQQLVGSSGCEVVVGPDLDQLADPAQQLAGLPEGVQQVLRNV
jgi:hypothetical protein